MHRSARRCSKRECEQSGVTTTQADSRDVLERIRCDTPVAPIELDGVKATASALHMLARRKLDVVDDDDRRALNAFCRDLAIRSSVFESYGPDWSPRADRIPLPPTYWPLLIAVLIGCADSTFPQDTGDRRLGVKCLNAALSALDVAGAMPDVADLSPLRTLTDSLLGSVSCEDQP